MGEAFSQINKTIKIPRLFLCPLKAAFFCLLCSSVCLLCMFFYLRGRKGYVFKKRWGSHRKMPQIYSVSRPSCVTVREMTWCRDEKCDFFWLSHWMRWMDFGTHPRKLRHSCGQVLVSLIKSDLLSPSCTMLPALQMLQCVSANAIGLIPSARPYVSPHPDSHCFRGN